MKRDNGHETDGIGPRIRRLRRERGLSQKELAEPVASPSFLSLIETGARHPSSDVLAHIAARLDVDPQELLTGRPPNEDVRLELELQEARDQLRLGQLDAAVQQARRVAAQADQLGFRRTEAKCHEVLASVEEKRGRPASALDLYRKAEALWTGEPPHLRFETIVGLGRCTLHLGNARFAAHLLETYLMDLDKDGVPDPTATMRTYSSLVQCYSTMGLAAKAAEAAELAQALAPRVTDAEQLACMNMNVARSLFDQGKIADSLDAIRQAERAFQTLGWEVDAARAQLSRGLVQLEKGDVDEARENLTAAATALRAADNLTDAAKALNELGRLERTAGNLAEAERHLQEAQGYLAGSDFAERALNQRELGLCLAEKQEDEAMGYMRRAIDLYVLAGATKEVAVTYKRLGDLQRTLGDVDGSLESYRAGLEFVETGTGDIG
ncbi:MAG TPA: helix-turn-helix transcriptional regulator [Actinomycetota bacterium]|nr:helix-turn-helix transcriptional regulator [Actinomycetota bacterium]